MLLQMLVSYILTTKFNKLSSCHPNIKNTNPDTMDYQDKSSNQRERVALDGCTEYSVLIGTRNSTYLLATNICCTDMEKVMKQTRVRNTKVCHY